jgi:MFS family permease
MSHTPAHNRRGPLLAAVFAYEVGIEAAMFIGLTGYALYVLGVAAPINALVMGLYLVGQIISVSLAGPLIDRWGPRVFIMLTLILLAFICLAGLLVNDRVRLFLVFAFFFGFALTLPQTGINSISPYLTKSNEGLHRINADILIVSFVAATVGPALAALLTTTFPVVAVFLFCAITAVLSCVLWFFTAEKHRPPRQTHDSSLRELTSGIRLVWTDPILRFYVFAGSFMWLAVGTTMVLEGYYFNDIMGLPVSWLGWSMAISGLGTVIGATIYASIPARLRGSRLLVGTIIAIGCCLVLVYGTHSRVAILVGSFLFGIPFGIAEPLNRTLTHSVSPLESVGRIQAVARLFRVLFTLVPLSLAAWFAARFGVQEVLVGAALTLSVLGLALINHARRVDHLR